MAMAAFFACYLLSNLLDVIYRHEYYAKCPDTTVFKYQIFQVVSVFVIKQTRINVKN